MAGARRLVWNGALAQRQERYQQTGNFLPLAELSRRLTALKPPTEAAWLRDVGSQGLQQALGDFERAYQNFFERRARFPRFKKPQRGQGQIPHPAACRGFRGADLGSQGGLPSHSPITARRRGVEKRVLPTGRLWELGCVAGHRVHDSGSSTGSRPSRRAVAADFGLKDFAVLSDGRRVPALQDFRRRERKLRRAQRTWARRRMRSQRRAKAKQAAAQMSRENYERCADFRHKFTTQLVGEREGICLEDLSIWGLAKTKLAQSILDGSWGEFRRQIEYKSVWNHRHLEIVDRFYPSSKTCHDCGAVNAGLTLADRTWTCVCTILQDRAQNLLSEGLKRIPLAAGHAESLDARGPGIRPPVKAIGDESGIPRL